MNVCRSLALAAAGLLFMAGSVRADKLVEMWLGDFQGQAELVDAFLTAEFGEMYTGQPATRWDVFETRIDDTGYILFQFPPMCDSDGCPLLIYDASGNRWKFQSETRVHARLYGSLALAHLDGRLLQLRSEVGKTGFFAERDFIPMELVEAHYGQDLYGAGRVELDQVYVGRADLDEDGRDEIFIFVNDPWQCSAWWSHCVTQILARGWEPTPWGRTFEIQGETWREIRGFRLPFSCPGRMGGCYGLYLLDQSGGRLPAILTTISIEGIQRYIPNVRPRDQMLCGPPPGFLRPPCYQ